MNDDDKEFEKLRAENAKLVDSGDPAIANQARFLEAICRKVASPSTTPNGAKSAKAVAAKVK